LSEDDTQEEDDAGVTTVPYRLPLPRTAIVDVDAIAAVVARLAGGVADPETQTTCIPLSAFSPSVTLTPVEWLSECDAWTYRVPAVSDTLHVIMEEYGAA
jgi:hypothetical protein